MVKVRETRRPIVVQQWKHELERMRAEISLRHNLVIESMRESETSLLEALYSCAESKRGQVGLDWGVVRRSEFRRKAIEHRIVQIARRLGSARVRS